MLCNIAYCHTTSVSFTHDLHISNTTHPLKCSLVTYNNHSDIDPCDYVQCHQYGYCINGSCQCRTGFEGNGYYDCRRIQVGG